VPQRIYRRRGECFGDRPQENLRHVFHKHVAQGVDRPGLTGIFDFAVASGKGEKVG